MTYGGSNPPLSTKSNINAGVTQLVESQPSKLLVAGSIPVSRSTRLRSHMNTGPADWSAISDKGTGTADLSA